MWGPEPSGPAEPPTSRRRGTDPPRLCLDQLRCGQIRTVGLRLVEVRERERVPTDFFLDVKLTCVVQDQAFLADVKADFGASVPPEARLAVLTSRCEATPPVALVEAGAVVERSLLLEVDEGTDRVIFWVETKGGGDVPEWLAAAIQVRPSPENEERDDLDTMRLPPARQALKRELAGALCRMPSPTFSTLGQLMASNDFDRKTYFLERLVEGDADTPLVEAAVRDFDFCHQAVQGFMSVDFSSLCLSDLVQASIAVFHPASPPELVGQCLVVGTARQLAGWPAGKIRLSHHLDKAAVLRLHRRAPEALDEILDDMLFDEDPSRMTSLRRLVDWAAARKRPAPRQPQRPIDRYLGDIAAEDSDAARRAAIELLAIGGFICISGELD
jgi:hypothetical protein